MLVLDASVILAAILGEPGGDIVFERIEGAVVSTVNIAEVYSYASVNGLATDALDAFFGETGVEQIAFDHAQAIRAGELAGVTRQLGLSLGDRACLALAAIRKVEVLTADRPWAKAAKAVGVTVTLLR